MEDHLFLSLLVLSVKIILHHSSLSTAGITNAIISIDIYNTASAYSKN